MLSPLRFACGERETCTPPKSQTGLRLSLKTSRVRWGASPYRTDCIESGAVLVALRYRYEKRSAQGQRRMRLDRSRLDAGSDRGEHAISR